jgi:hypothetical protein
MWAYTVSHKELLLRSRKDDEGGTRIDVLFKGVEALCLPTKLTNLAIREASDEEAAHGLGGLAAADPTGELRVFLVQSAEGEGRVVALVMFYAEDDGWWHEPSPLWRSG